MAINNITYLLPWEGYNPRDYFSYGKSTIEEYDKEQKGLPLHEQPPEEYPSPVSHDRYAVSPDIKSEDEGFDLRGVEPLDGLW